MSFHIWEGIYKNFAECPTSGAGFDGAEWVQNSRDRIQKLRKELGANKDSSLPMVAYHLNFLPLAVETVLKNSNMVKMSVLDFGGGLGYDYLLLSHGINKENLQYHIIETKSVCEEGTEIFKGNGHVYFHPDFPEKKTKVDLVHLNSSLQYVDDWGQLLERLAQYQPQYFAFTDLLAGEVPTYVSAQNYYQSKFPCRFLNINEFLDKMAAIHFESIFQSVYEGSYLGKKQEIPQDNFPEEYRLKHSCNLLFRRRKP